MQTYAPTTTDLSAWIAPLTGRRVYDTDEYLPTPPSSSEYSSSDSDSSSSTPSSPDVSREQFDIPGSPPPPYPGLPSPPSSPTMTASSPRARHARPKPILVCTPFPHYDPRAPSSSSTQTAPFRYLPSLSPISPTSRRRLHSISESPMETSDSFLCEDGDVDMEIEDEEYDCGYAMDLGAESPSPSMRSISGSPGLGSRSSSSLFLSSSGSTSASSLSLPALVPDQADPLPESMSRKPGGAGAVYKREAEAPSEADERLTREWAVAAGVASTPVSPSIGRRTRGTSVSAAYPPATGVKSISRRSSRSARWDESDRDCGICFEYAVRPARTACCGKVFCQEHLEDWLNGPNASGLCPNCDAECSLEKDIISLATPKLSAVKPKPTTSEGRSSGSANTSTRRVVPSSPSALGLGLERSAVSRSSSSSFEPLTPVSPNTTSFDANHSTSNSSSTPTPMQPKPNFNVAQQALLSPPARSRTVSRSRSLGQLSPRSLFTSQQQYERLLAQEHRPSSPLSTSIPIVNPFDSAAIVGGIRRGVEALVATTVAREEATKVHFPSGEKTFVFPHEVKDAETDSEKGYAGNGKEPEMWNGLGKEGRKRVNRSDGEYAHVVRHAASLLGCLVVLYLVVR